MIDWTINVGNVLVMAGGIGSFLWGSIKVRDAMRDMRAAIGTPDHPRAGILGTLATHGEGIAELDKVTRRQREWLIEMNAKADEDHRVRMERS